MGKTHLDYCPYCEEFDHLSEEDREQHARDYYEYLKAYFPEAQVSDEYLADPEGAAMWAWDNLPDKLKPYLV